MGRAIPSIIVAAAVVQPAVSANEEEMLANEDVLVICEVPIKGGGRRLDWASPWRGKALAGVLAWPVAANARQSTNVSDGTTQMSVETRLFALAQENLELGHDPDWDVSLSESDISSMDAVAFIKLVNHEFGIEVPAKALAEIDTMRALAKYIEAAAA